MLLWRLIPISDYDGGGDDGVDEVGRIGCFDFADGVLGMDVGLLSIETAKAVVEAVGIRKKMAVRRTMRRELRRSVTKHLHIKQTEEAERGLVKALQPFFQDQIQDAAKRLKAMEEFKSFSSTKDFDDTAEVLTDQIFDPQQWQKGLIDRVLPHLARAMSEAAVSVWLTVGVDPRKSATPIQKYRPGQPRDSHGRFSSGGGGMLAPDTGGGTGGGGNTIDEDLMNVVMVGDENARTSGDDEQYAAWLEGMSVRERKALEAYRDMGKFAEINEYQRTGRSRSSRTERQAHDLYNALDRQNIPDGTELWRGLRITDPGEAKEFLGKIQVGSEIRNRGFTSVSRSSSIAGGFAAKMEASETPVLFKFKTKGAKGSFIGEPEHEPEHLLQASARIRIVRTTHYDSGLVLVEGTVGHVS